MQTEMKKKLKQIELFKDLPEKHLQKLSAIVQEKVFHKGDIIFEQGSPGNALYIVYSGEIVIKQTTKHEGKRMKTLAVIGKGDFFGEMSLLVEGAPRSANAISADETVLLTVPQKAFLRLLREDSVLARSLLSVIVNRLSERLRKTNSYFVTAFETGMVIGSTNNIQEMGNLILEKLIFALPGSEGGLFLLWNEFNEEYDVVSYRGYKGKSIKSLKVNSEEPFLKWLSQERKAMIVDDLDEEKRFQSNEKVRYIGKSMVGGPLIDEDKIRGFLILTNWSKTHTFQPGDEILLGTVANQIAPAVRVCMYKREEEDRKRLGRLKF